MKTDPKASTEVSQWNPMETAPKNPCMPIVLLYEVRTSNFCTTFGEYDPAVSMVRWNDAIQEWDSGNRGKDRPDFSRPLGWMYPWL